MGTICRAASHRSHVAGIRNACLGLVFVVCLGWGTAQAADGEPADPNTIGAQAELVARLTAESQASKAEAIRWAQEYGYPIRYEDDQRVCELMAVWRDRPVYYVTDNVNAAISTATDRIRDTVPWELDGNGVVVGLWDEACARATHQEFLASDGRSRVHVGDRGESSPHTTHVAGTLGAAGIDPAAKGMAPAATIQSFNWNYDAAKMATWTAYTPGQSDGIYVSNHSYGYVGGWVNLSTSDLTGHKGWHWTGLWAGTKSYDDWFGVYHAIARQWDDVAYTKNYYLAFAAAGNDRTDNPPLGETVYYSKSNVWYPIIFDLSTCPPGDGMAKGGYDTICGPGAAKNIMTVGAVGDAVADGARSLADANMATFSSWGPTNDGRVKPDIVANGIRLYSADSNTDDSYATHSGTSMASPNAAGSAALLVQLYQQLFPGKSMRASTLKGLIVQTADDLGRPGPDYQFGWGLMNARAAAELIQRQADEPAGGILLEGRLSANNPADTNPDDDYYFWADANEPIRVTLCWTDPPGVYITDYDNLAPRLIHDLDLRVIGPDRSTTYYPYILNRADPCAIATTGDNKLDNVEQIYIGTPAEAGLYRIHVGYKGQLSKDQQHYSIIADTPIFAQRPPVAEDTSVYTAVNTATTVSLKATDDALPQPPANLSYTIASLPKHGSLAYPAGTPIAAPGKLASYGNQVVYTPVPNYTGGDSFLFYADDGGTAPQGGASNMATVTIAIKNLVTREYQVIASGDDGTVLPWTRFQGTLDKYLRVGQYISAVRFQSIDIPRGAQIAGAYLKLCPETSTGLTGLIQAEATGNATDLTAKSHNILNMVRTQARVPWNWTGKEVAKQWCVSPDCSAVLQEIVGRSDWQASNAIVLIFSGTSAGTQDSLFYAYDYSAAYAPRLEITYIAESSPSTSPGQRPPRVIGTESYASAGTPVPIALEAEDDGLPEPLRLTIGSLPKHGSLVLVNGTPIKEPTSLLGSASRVTYTPNAGFAGDDSFTFYAEDGGTAPTGGKSNTATITLKVRHMVTREYQVIAPTDDAYGADDNAVVVSGTLSVGRQSAAMRFRNIDLPHESEVVSARLKICMDTTSIAKRVAGTLYAQAIGDTNDFNQPDLRIPALPRTQASVPWNWEAGRTLAREEYCSSPDLRAVVQEIIDRNDWSAGNCMTILYAGDASSGQDLTFSACGTLYSLRAAKLEITCVPKTTLEVIPPPVGQPPKAEDVHTETLVSEPVTITLTATDDGRPKPPGKLTYAIASLPSHGTLEIPVGGQLTKPATLPNSGNTVLYRPDPAFSGRDTFTFYADDGGTRPAGGQSNVATAIVMVRPPVTETITHECRISAKEDDGYAPNTTSSNVLSGVLRLGTNTMALRFTGVDVPQGRKVTGARLYLRLAPPPSGGVDLMVVAIQAEAAGDSAGLSADGRNICQLARTNTSIDWVLEVRDYPKISYPYEHWRTTSDICQVIQEVVDRLDWSPGSAISLILWNRTGPSRDWLFYSYDDDPAYAPWLEITFSQ